MAATCLSLHLHLCHAAYVVLYERVCFFLTCVCLCERERIGPVSHLIVIAPVFGLETVDRNQQSLVVMEGVGGGGTGGPRFPLPSVLVVMHPSTNRDQDIRDSGYLY